MTVHAPIQADFEYGSPASDGASLRLAVSVFADRGHVRDAMRDDAQAAGFRVREAGVLASLLDRAATPLGEVVLIDCPCVHGAAIAALSRLDMRAAHCGAQLIVATTVDALEEVFACMDQSRPQLLVDASRADRIVALGQAVARGGSARVREISEEDRLLLLRLTEQVGQIAEQLERIGQGALAAPPVTSGSAFRFGSPDTPFHGAGDAEDRLTREARPPLPDPRLVRRIIRQRQQRAQFFDGDLFADPAWDMLLDLTAARAEHTRVSVTSLCIASGVPPTTALRWIGQMSEAGLFERVEDDSDRRRAFIALSDRAADAMARYFAGLGRSAGNVI